ncbi:heterokaryon incompatibility protein-domain-containing protein [Phascolomyces articulosus]|uniref:Heterokaryon incompatibility protein-domain-containing protein n=1 Tax=Phascolomyces articulosus TaxID=60185 RepID=A0AAD5KJG3_9FUNG|nr:heterokaryon incompatibility protein-domain-containing protein [Phascolomyces articulosus]
MYITYCRDQKAADLVDTSIYRHNATSGTFRPTWLIRISDWQKVPGTEAQSGYCTLSYCWEQSGEVVPREDGTGEYDCIDNGLHQLAQKVKASTRGKKRYRKKAITQKYVTFEQLIQQLCTDFQIDFIWYDKICINQLDKHDKHRELKQMHLIYSNAKYSIALVPEMKIYSLKDFARDHLQQGNQARGRALEMMFASRWWKRSWTLEEIMMSKSLLLVGTDINLWQHSLMSNIPTTVDLLSNALLDYSNRKRKSINQALYEAHFRTSTKQHDKIFALANIYPDIFNRIELSYDIDPQTTFYSFYRTIALNDLSMMCFGANIQLDKSIFRTTTMHHHNLPSWTGVEGLHVPFCVATITAFQSPHFIDDNMHLHIRSRYGILPIEQYLSNKTTNTNDYANQMDTTMDNRNKGQFTDLSNANDNTVLLELRVDMLSYSNCKATHYFRADPITNAKSLSLTINDNNCNDCVALPILFSTYYQTGIPHDPVLRTYTPGPYLHAYFVPVFQKCRSSVDTQRYKAVGIMLVAAALENEAWDPHELLNILFDPNDSCDEFIIE